MSQVKIFKRISKKNHKAYRRKIMKAIKELNGFIKVKPHKANGKLRKENGYTYFGTSC